MSPAAVRCCMRRAAVSSTSMISGSASVATVPRMSVTGPTNHCSRSRVWIAWFIRTPPPAVAQRPRQSRRA